MPLERAALVRPAATKYLTDSQWKVRRILQSTMFVMEDQRQRLVNVV